MLITDRVDKANHAATSVEDHPCKLNPISAGFRSLGYDEVTGLKFVRDFGTDNDLYQRLQTVRHLGGPGQYRFFFDEHSYHYGLIDGDRAVGTLTATRLADGEMDCQTQYPSPIREAFRSQIYSTCKLRIAAGRHSSFRTLRMMLRHVWKDQLELGSRLVLINTERKMTSFYQRVGFEVIEGTDFIHPLLHTDSICMLLRADPSSRSFFADLFQGVEPTLSRQQIDACSAGKNAREGSIQDLLPPQLQGAR